MNEEFCDGVKILLKRMESNPEEFRGQDHKWHNLIPKGSGGYVDWSHALTEEETKALAEGIRKIHRVVFTEKVMSTLLYSTEEAVQDPYTVKGVPPGTWVSVSGAGGGGSGVVGSPFQNSITYPTLSAFAESQPPKNKPTLGEMLKQKIARL